MPNNSARIIKTPEQLQIGDVIPVWGEDLVVEFVAPLFADEDGEYKSIYSKVHFTNGRTVQYAPGACVHVIKR